MFEPNGDCISPSKLLKQAEEASATFQPLFMSFNCPLSNGELEEKNMQQESKELLTEFDAMPKAPTKVYFPESEFLAKQPSMIRLNRLVETKLRLKIHGFDNLAQRQVAISEGKYNRVARYRKKLARVDNTNSNQGRGVCREVVSEREQQCWWKIVLSPYFRENKRKSRMIYRLNECHSMRSMACLMGCIGAIIPNNLTLRHFLEFHGRYGWSYSTNPAQKMEVLPLRWLGEQANFLEPLVLRYRTDSSGRRLGFEGLCPYCPMQHEDRLNGYDSIFFNLRSCSYEAHLARKHGVYGSGEELSPPVFVQKDFEAKFVCMECQRVNSISGGPLDANSFQLEYFRHCVNSHYRRKSGGSANVQFQRH